MKTFINISINKKHESILQQLQLERNLRSYTKVVESLLLEQTTETQKVPYDRFAITSRRYIGSKAKLLSFIEQSIKSTIGDFSSFVDIFSGTGSVGNHFNRSDRRIITNDLLYSNYLSNVAFLGNENINYDRIEKILNILNNLDTKRDNYFSKTFGNKFFSTATARRIGLIRENIEKDLTLNTRERAILITSLIYACDKIANTCGHYDAYRENTVFNDNLKLKHLDIFHNSNMGNLNFNEDANRLFKGQLDYSVDIVYADPPYNSRQYGTAYHVLENLARWEKPKVEGKAAKMTNRKELNSNYCQKNAIESLDDLLSSIRAKYFILSYSDMGVKGNDRSNARMNDKDIIRTLKKYGDIEIKVSEHRPFSTGKSNIAEHKERLFICELKDQY